MIDFINYEISDELLAAYVDGKTSLMENAIVENSINLDSQLSEVFDIVHDSISFGNLFDWELHQGDFSFWELGLSPAITQAEFDMIANDLQNSFTPSFQEEPISDIDRENLCVFDDSFADESHSIEENNNNLDFSDECDSSDDFEPNV